MQICKTMCIQLVATMLANHATCQDVIRAAHVRGEVISAWKINGVEFSSKFDEAILKKTGVWSPANGDPHPGISTVVEAASRKLSELGIDIKKTILYSASLSRIRGDDGYYAWRIAYIYQDEDEDAFIVIGVYLNGSVANTVAHTK